MNQKTNKSFLFYFVKDIQKFLNEEYIKCEDCFCCDSNIMCMCNYEDQPHLKILCFNCINDDKYCECGSGAIPGGSLSGFMLRDGTEINDLSSFILKIEKKDNQRILINCFADVSEVSPEIFEKDQDCDIIPVPINKFGEKLKLSLNKFGLIFEDFDGYFDKEYYYLYLIDKEKNLATFESPDDPDNFRCLSVNKKPINNYELYNDKFEVNKIKFTLNLYKK